MFGIVLATYLGCWLATSIAAYGARRWLSERCSPAPHPLLVSVAAGAVWPLLLIGLVELSSVMVYTKAHAKPESGIGIFA